MSAWLVGVALASAAWALGVRRGKLSREPEVELAYNLGVADGRREAARELHRAQALAPSSEMALVQIATLEAAEACSSATWIVDGD